MNCATFGKILSQDGTENCGDFRETGTEIDDSFSPSIKSGTENLSHTNSNRRLWIIISHSVLQIMCTYAHKVFSMYYNNNNNNNNYYYYYYYYYYHYYYYYRD